MYKGTKTTRYVFIETKNLSFWSLKIYHVSLLVPSHRITFNILTVKTKMADKKTSGGPMFKEFILEGLKHKIINI